MSTEIGPGDRPAIAPKLRFQWEEAQGCHVLLYPEGMVKLNQAAGEILKRCTGELRVEEIIAELSASFPGADSLPADVYRFLNDAHEKQWIQCRPA